MASGKTVLVLGGGVGGIVAASKLRKALPHPHRVILVEREEDHVFAPSFLWLMIGDRSPEQITRPIRALERKGIEVTRGKSRASTPKTAQLMSMASGWRATT